MKLRNYTLKYNVIALLCVVALWAALFYAVMLEEVYDNIDDGLKNSKILIIREAYANPQILSTPEFGINQFRITPLPKDDYDYSDHLFSTSEFSEYDNEDQPIRQLEAVFNDAKGNPHKLTIKASTVEEDELLEDLLTALIALYIMLVISIAVINQLVQRKVWTPFYTLLERLKYFKPGMGTVFKAPESPVSEFSMLGSELEDLIARNEAIYANQKQFIENASHELQTPLAISLNKLELFVENNPLPEEQMMEISRIGDTLSRLVRLNKSLLMLSKIENRQYPDEERINFSELAERLVDDFSDLAQYKAVTMTINTVTNLIFTMNRGLALTLVSNLVKNAIVHNHRGGNVTILINNHSLTVINTGSDKPLKKEAVFRRFYKDSASEQGTGLGLSIVKSITESYKLCIAYDFDKQHSFTVTFPEKR